MLPLGYNRPPPRALMTIWLPERLPLRAGSDYCQFIVKALVLGAKKS
jgi:hypothetical protein